MKYYTGTARVTTTAHKTS